MNPSLTYGQYDDKKKETSCIELYSPPEVFLVWKCIYCDNVNQWKEHVCTVCGSPIKESTNKYFLELKGVELC